jgi:homospermidine synthase
MKREIKYPIWENEEKTKIRCKFHYENGEEFEASITDTEEGNPDWAEIMETFGVKGVDESHEKHLAEREKQRELHEAQKKEQIETEKASILFSAKLEAFEIAEVKASKDRVMKSRIRKAASITEVSALTAVLIMKEIDNEEVKDA